jgi:murein DD-endopeptidase MepM/ murein hydrolase activator NlpD
MIESRKTITDKILADHLITEKVKTDQIITENLIVKRTKEWRMFIYFTVIFAIYAITTYLYINYRPQIIELQKIPADVAKINADVADIKKGINDLFIIAKLTKTNDSIRDVNTQHLPKYLPLPPQNMNKISSLFGRRDEGYHMGIDYVARMGTSVYATGSGIVTKAQYTGNYGNLIEIDHLNRIITRNGHLKEIFVVVGQKVYQGQLIGTVGMTGNATGPHLHFEIQIDNKNIDPAFFVIL